MTSGYTFIDLVQKAQFRWLKPEEVVFILQNFEENQLSPEPTSKPPNGSLFLFNKRVVRYFCEDGHNWRKKKDGRTVGEAHERLKAGNVALNCYYALGDLDPNFQRRSYWNLDPEVEHIVLVHYRDISKTYREFAHLEIQLEEIESATNNFADENLIKEGGSGKYYKGKMLRSGQLIDIVARKLSRKYGQGDVEFWTEISMLSSLEHNNIISIIGFCDDKNEKIIVYDHAVHGSLDQHLSDPTLTWFQRLQICLGAARALSYIHYDIIHCDINSSNIFLDKDWEPKISGFELSTRYPQSWRHRLLFSRYFDTKSMTPKYDVYSFGVLLFDVLCGRKPMIKNDGAKEELDEIIDPGLRKQMDKNSLDVFSKTADNCLNHQLVQRPTMDQVVKELEDALEHQWKHENSEHPTAAYEGTSSNQLKMEWLKIPLSEIKKATDNFNALYSVGYGGYGTVYKAQLEVLDILSLSSMQGKSKDELPKRSQTVAIKHILSRPDEQGEQGFFTEIELLTSCKHPNIVTLLGFSKEAGEMILVYEYAFKGSLNDYLGNTCKTINLTWVQRIQICLDVAHGIEYLHTNMDGKPRIIHRDIKSDNILLDENLKAKVADFGLSRFHPTNQQTSTIYTKNIAGTEVYVDPEYLTTFKYKKESDIYAFGVVLFEILSGRLAYDPIYMMENDKGLAPIARRRFNEGTLKELIDPKIIEEDGEHIFTLNRGPNQDSFDTFSRIAYQCLAETQAKRPTMEAVIKELQNVLKLQGETMVLSRFRLNDIVLATENFSETYCIGLDAYGVVYIAELVDFESKSLMAVEGKNTSELTNRQNTVAIKRISSRESGKEKERFFKEIEMRSSYKHPNIVSLLGFCDEGGEMILVYEHASHKSLDDYLTRVDNFNKFTWTQRLYMCLEIARGLDHLHTKMGDQQKIVHGDIKSANILICDNRVAKISYFGISKLSPTNKGASTLVTANSLGWTQRMHMCLEIARRLNHIHTKMGDQQKIVHGDTKSYSGISKLSPVNQGASTLVIDNRVGTKVYWGPEYEKTGKLEIESDIYSFGVVLFEIFCGRVAYDPVYLVQNDKGLAPIALQCFNDGTLKKMIDPKLKEETNEDICSSSKGPNQDSMDTFAKIACQCLVEDHAKRPTMAIVIKELEIALDFQENLMQSLQISVEDIELVTENFSQKNYVGSGRYWKAYRGELSHANGRIKIFAKRWDTKSGKGDNQFQTELDILFKRKHENIVGLVGYCNEMNEKIIVYEHAFSGSLDMYLDDANLTWMRRLKICIDIASGLEFLHGGAVTLKKLVHRDIKSTSILLTDDWKAKVSNLELCSLDSSDQNMEHVTDSANGTFSYLDPEYKQGFLTEKSDIYSFGVILLELLCGRLACGDDGQSLHPLAKNQFVQGNLDVMVFKAIKKQIDPKSLNTFAEIAHRCLRDDGYKRPGAGEVVIQLKKALEFQEDYEMWEPKLPKDYREIISSSETPENYYTETKKDFYKKLSDGILLQRENVWFTLTDNGIANKMISATMFSYEKSVSHKWRSVHKSRFRKVAKISDTSNLKMQITINDQFLSPGVIYGVHLVFRFCESRKVSSKPIYVNLKHIKGSETLHSYFATWRDDEWMTTELCRFLKDKEDIDIEVLLESFSRYYCGGAAIYVQGIEFRAIENVAHENIKNLEEGQQVQESNLIDQVHQFPTNNDDEDEKASLRELNGKKHLLLSAKEVLYSSLKLEPFRLIPSSESRFPNVIELLPQQAFRIKYRIESRMLSPFTEYACYLVFKLSEKCCGLYCPVKVQDLRNRRNKETKIIYFRSPSTSNLQDANWIPKQRKDGCMEVIIWRFNSKNKLGNNIIPMNLKLITYEETMSGLIICGLKFRPI